jgi:hypothetical protein
MGNAALKRNRREFGEAGRFASAAGIPSLAMMNDFGGTSKPAYFADTSNVTAIPFDAKLEVFVGIKTLRVNCKFCHNQ